MANHPHRSNPAYRTIRGATMDAGFRTDRATRFMVCKIGGAIYEYDEHLGQAATWNPPLVLDVDGQITRKGAAAGYGFLPNDGEVERLAAVGYIFPQLT